MHICSIENSIWSFFVRQGTYDVLMVEKLISEAILHRYITSTLITYKQNLVPLPF